MDFGLDKLVEMLEERFGRVAGTIVLAAIGIAAIAFALHAVFQYLVMPIAKYAPDVLGAFNIAVRRMTLADAINAGLQIAIGALAGIVAVAVYSLLTKRLTKNVRRALREAHDIVDDCRAYSDKNHDLLDKHLEQVRSESDKMVEHAVAAANQIIWAAQDRAGSPRSEPLSLKSLQDTEEKGPQ
jgi:hypothetical protein